MSEHISYVTLREDFNEYTIENGQILKAKIILSDILVDTDPEGKKNTVIGLKDFSLTITPKKIDTSTLATATPEEITEKDVISELKFSVSREIVNIYETTGYIILVAPKIKAVYLTNKKDLSEDPILRYTLETGLSTIEKSTLTQKSVPVR